jgi:hypothetical protein
MRRCSQEPAQSNHKQRSESHCRRCRACRDAATVAKQMNQCAGVPRWIGPLEGAPR